MVDSFKVARGIEIPDLNGIHEAYSVQQTPDGYTLLLVNVSFENIAATFLGLMEQVQYPGYFVVEVNRSDNAAPENTTGTEAPKSDVFYLDGISIEQAKSVYSRYETNLLQDGGVSFGVGSHAFRDEVFVAPYKLFHIHADDAAKYVAALGKLGFRRDPVLRTVWDNFTPYAPGRRQSLADLGRTTAEMIEEMTRSGFYLAENR